VKKLLYMVLPLLGLLACSTGCDGESHKWHQFGVNGRAALCVPDSDMDRDLVEFNEESKNLKLQPGWTPGFGFLFAPNRVREDISAFRDSKEFGWHPYANALSGSVGFLDMSDRGRYGSSMRARDVRDIWTSTGTCSKSEIVQIEGGLYSAKCSPADDYSSIWNRRPRLSEAMPNPDDFVVATCRDERIDVGPHSGATMRTCSRVILISEYIVDYRFQEANVRFIADMDTLLAKKIAEWRRNCSSR